jgi:hypothetical protein
VEIWHCPTCRRQNVSAFCPSCGEILPDIRKLELGAILRHIFHGISSLDGPLFTSAVMLIRHPGQLTLAFLQGRHKPFTGPFRLFLFANMLFFAMQSFTQIEIFGESLSDHMTAQDWSPVARALVSSHSAGDLRTPGEFAADFDKAAVLKAKSLIVLMVLPFATVLSFIFLRAHRPFGLHLVFALHFYSFLMLIFCGLLAIASIDKAIGGGGISTLDKPLFGLTLMFTTAYLLISTGVVYEIAGIKRLISVVALTCTVGVMISGYRFAIFLITLYTA